MISSSDHRSPPGKGLNLKNVHLHPIRLRGNEERKVTTYQEISGTFSMK